MFSQEFNGHSPGEHTNEYSSTSYTFGPHHKRQGDYIFYALDNFVTIVLGRIPDFVFYLLGHLLEVLVPNGHCCLGMGC